jgi:hypothetical protein
VTELDYLRQEESRLIDEIVRLRKQVYVMRDVLHRIVAEPGSELVWLLASYGLKETGE